MGARTWLVAGMACASLLVGAAGAQGAPVVACSGDPGVATRIDMTVAGAPTYGLYAVPSGPPRGLVVVDHGYSHTVESWRKHLSNLAKRNGVIAVAMNYRGTVDIPSNPPGGRPSSRGWQVQEGAEDSIAVARLFDGQCPGLPTIDLYSVSMGGNAAGLAAAARAKRFDGRPLWDFWFNVEGAVNVIETYVGARQLAPVNTFARNASEDIEREMGGTLEQRSSVYQERAVVNRVQDIKASGLRGVVLVHGLGDGLVPYDQAQELVARLRENGIPSDLFSVGTRGSGEPGTTLDGYVTGGIPTYQSPFAGHASEASDSHVVGNTGFDRLAAFFARGEAPCDRSFAVDGDTATVSPDPATASPQCPFRFPSGSAGGGAPRQNVSVGLPGARSCRGRRLLLLHVRAPRRQRLVQAAVYVNGRRVRRRRDHDIRTLALRNLPARAFTVRVVAITSAHRLHVVTRRYAACRR
jgi:fermentation-respiration switch protein FrsA (DUF1100 family)